MTTEANSRQIGGNHYKRHKVQVWDAILTWGLGFLDGNVVKYVVRYRDKGGIEDLEKAKHYLEKLIETEKAARPEPYNGAVSNKRTPSS